MCLLHMIVKKRNIISKQFLKNVLSSISTLIHITETNGPLCCEVQLSNFDAFSRTLATGILWAKNKISCVLISKEFCHWELLWNMTLEEERFLRRRKLNTCAIRYAFDDLWPQGGLSSFSPCPTTTAKKGSIWLKGQPMPLLSSTGEKSQCAWVPCY